VQQPVARREHRAQTQPREAPAIIEIQATNHSGNRLLKRPRCRYDVSFTSRPARPSQSPRTARRCVIPRSKTQPAPILAAPLAASIATALAAAPAAAGPVIAPGWGYPVFQENFDGGSVDQGVWQVANWPGNNNNESQYYHPGQVSVSGGALHLRADYDPNWSFGRQYNSGLIRSWQEWSYGRVEVRAKVPFGQGFWPAIWLLPRGAAWPAGGEIDIMEARGDLPWRISSAVHWGWDVANHQYVSQAYESGANFQAGYHDYAVEWEVGTVRFYVDGVQHFTVYEPAVGIPSTAKSIVLNLAVGGDYSGYPDGSTPFPSQFDVDYVRVWERQPWVNPPQSLITDPGFEDDDGAMADWGRFGNSIENISSDWGTPSTAPARSRCTASSTAKPMSPARSRTSPSKATNSSPPAPTP
jgi:beta-glucanase (GH16 family)